MAGRRICAGYYRRYDGKVVSVVSLATDAHQLDRGSVDHLQKKFFSALARLLKERDEAEGKCRLSQTVKTESNHIQTERLLCQQALRFSLSKNLCIQKEKARVFT